MHRIPKLKVSNVLEAHLIHDHSSKLEKTSMMSKRKASHQKVSSFHTNNLPPFGSFMAYETICGQHKLQEQRFPPQCTDPLII